MQRRRTMSGRKRWVAGALVVAAIAVAGCSEGDESESSGDPAATLETVDGSDVPRVVLVPKAAERIGIEFASVADLGDGTRAVPYAAVVYDPDGTPWVYTNPERRTYERQPITIASIDGDDAILSDGPPAGTEVVTIGTAELYGVENEIGG
jgi:hypothetical protein